MIYLDKMKYRYMERQDQIMKIAEQTIEINGKKIILRSPRAKDATEFLKVRRVTLEESYYMARYPEEIISTVEDVAGMLEKVNASEYEFYICAFVGETMVGCLNVAKMGSHIKYRHKVGLGISILDIFCNGGLGTQMMKLAIEAVKMTPIEQIELGVFADNLRAHHLYQKLGFVEWGREPRAFKLKDGTYHDEIQMVLMLR